MIQTGPIQDVPSTVTVSSSFPLNSGEPLVFSIPSSSLDYHVECVLHQYMNQLKARILNLAEVAAPETRQCNALKGLMKDAINQAYYGALRELTDVLRERGHIEPGTGHSPIMGLKANSLADVLVD